MDHAQEITFSPYAANFYKPRELLLRNKRDFAMVEFLKIGNLEDMFIPACLPTKPAPGAETSCYVAGVKDGSMKTSQMKILSKEECRKLSPNEYDKYDKNFEISQWEICAVNLKNQDCNQNVGSSLICNENGKAVVYGVAVANFLPEGKNHFGITYSLVNFSFNII